MWVGLMVGMSSTMIAVIGTTFMFGRMAAIRASGATAIRSTSRSVSSVWWGMTMAISPPYSAPPSVPTR